MLFFWTCEISMYLTPLATATPRSVLFPPPSHLDRFPFGVTDEKEGERERRKAVCNRIQSTLATVLSPRRPSTRWRAPTVDVVCVCVCVSGGRDEGRRGDEERRDSYFFFGEMQTRRGENLGQFNRDGKRTLAFALVGLNLLPYRRRSPPRTNHSSGFFFRPCRLFRLHMTALLTS